MIDFAVLHQHDARPSPPDPDMTVIGETAVVGDGVCLLQGVTLGGTGNQTGNRHPKVGKGCHIGVGSSILGNIPLGEVSRKRRNT